jgi:Glycosyltransferase family 87
MPRTRSSSSRSSFLPAELRGPLLAGVGVFVASWAFVSFVPAFSAWLYGDVRFYETWGSYMSNHLVPYRDFDIEYPPGALPVFLVPVYLRKLADYHGTYYFWFRVELLVIGSLALVAMAHALAQLRASPRRAYAALCFAGLGPALLGPDALARFDYWPALFGVAAVAALAARRPLVACGFAALGTAIKVYPAVLIPLALIELWRRQGARAVGKAVALSVALVAAIVVPFLIVAPHGVSWAVHRQFNRPLQVESLGAVFFAAAHQIAGVHLHVVKGAGSDNLVGSGPHLVATLSGVVTVLAILGVYALYVRNGRTREDLVTACVAAVTAYIAFSKVFSPQYLVWLIPLVPLVGGRRGLRASALFLVILGLTQIWSPYRYGDYHLLRDAWLVWVVVARDLLVLVLLAMLVRPSGRDADELDAARPAVV